MIRAVLDVNVIVSAFPAPNGTPGRLVAAWLDGRFTLVASETMLDRLAIAWRKPYFVSRVDDQLRDDAFDVLGARAEFVTPAPDVRGVADDLEDDLVLATAVAGNASHLVTGDRGLLACNGYRGLTLLTPAAFRLVLDDPDIAP